MATGSPGGTAVDGTITAIHCTVNIAFWIYRHYRHQAKFFDGQCDGKLNWRGGTPIVFNRLQAL